MYRLYHRFQTGSKKKSENHPLTQEEKSYNRKLSRERIIVENINAKIKVFRSMSSRYRNRRKRHTLRISLICRLLHFELRN
ncbi:transposase family protein [Bacillus thuringiensis]|uniref:transposase family protein n=1 Tax=Bacillus thuringiensis TaxID=1428 RepID=UPI00345AEAE6